jgi:large subunit ribosomal protein L16
VKIKNKEFMLLQPKKTKYKKIQKGKLNKYSFRSNKLQFGDLGLKAAKSGTISARQIEAARQAIVRKLNRKGKLWIRIFPNIPITAKPTEVRMGKGKGAVAHWGVKVSAGTVLFEICGISKNIAITAFKTGGAKLPIKTAIFV